MDLLDLVQRLTIVATTEGVGAASSALKDFAAAQTQTAASALSAEKAAAIVERRWDASAKVARQVAIDTRTLVVALQQNGIEAEKAARLIATMGQRLDEVRQKSQAAATVEEQHARALAAKRAAWEAEASAISRAEAAQRSYNATLGVQSEPQRARSSFDNQAIARQMQERAAAEEAAQRAARAEAARRDAAAAADEQRVRQRAAEMNRMLGVPSRSGRDAEFDRNAALAADIEQRAAEQSRRDAAAEIKRRAEAAANAQSANAAFSSQLGVPTATSRNEQFNRNAAIAAAMEERATEQMRAMRDEATQLIRVIDPLAEAQSRYNAEIARYAKLADVGLISSEQQNRANAIALQKLKDVQETAAQPGKVISRNAWLMQDLSFQVNDIVSGLAMGQSPFTIMAQQGGQVYQVLSMARGGVGGGLKDIGEMIVSMVTPARALMGALALGGVTAAASIYRLRSEQEALVVSLNGAGRAAGVSPVRLRSMSDASADRAGISRSTANDLAGGFAATGQIGAPLIGQLLETTRRYAKVTGQGLSEAGKELAGAFADPAKGADTLNQRLGMLDDRTRQNIKNMQEQGNLLGAQALLFDKLAQSTQKAVDPTSNLVKSWEAVKKAVDDAYGSIGRALDPGPLDRIRQLENSKIPGMFGFMSPGARQQNANADIEIARIRREMADAEAKMQKEAADKIADDRAAQVGDVIRGSLPDLAERQGLTNRLASLSSGLADPAVSGKLSETLTDAQRAYEALTNAQRTYLTSADRERQSTDLSVRSILARTLAEREAIAVAQTRLDLSGKIVDAETRAAMEARKTAEVMAEASKKSRDALRDTQEEADRLMLRPFQSRQKQIEQQERRFREETEIQRNVAPAPRAEPPAVSSRPATLREAGDILAEVMARGQQTTGQQRYVGEGHPLFGQLGGTPYLDARNRAANDNRGQPQVDVGSAKPDNDKQFALQRQMNVQSNFDLPMMESRIALEAQIASLNKQAEAFGKSTEQATALAKEQELLNQFARAGVPLTDGQKEQVRGLAEQYGAAARAAEELQLKQKKTVESMDLVRGGFDDVAGGWLRGLRNGEKGIDAFRAGLDRLNERLLNMAINQLSGALFGQSGTAGGTNPGLLGGPLASLFSGFFGGGGYSASTYFASAASAAPGMYGPGFANGGIMSSNGPLPLHRYAKGGVATSPQMAIFGEGRGPEAYVPLPDGRSIPVTMKGGGGNTPPPANNNVNIVVENHGASVEQKTETGPGGEQFVRMIVRGMFMEDISGNGTIAKGLQNQYGLNRMAGRR